MDHPQINKIIFFSVHICIFDVIGNFKVCILPPSERKSLAVRVVRDLKWIQLAGMAGGHSVGLKTILIGVV